MISSIHKKNIMKVHYLFLLSFKHLLVHTKCLVLIVEDWQQVYSKLQHPSQYRYQQRRSLQSQLLHLRFFQCLFRVIQTASIIMHTSPYSIFDIFLSSRARSWYLFSSFIHIHSVIWQVAFSLCAIIRSGFLARTEWLVWMQTSQSILCLFSLFGLCGTT